MRGKGLQQIPAGDRLLLALPGGAGLGPASERSPAAIAADLKDGLLSLQAARRDYGWQGPEQY